MSIKLELTKYLINHLGLLSPNEKSFKAWIHKIWQNPRSKSNGGLRLTPEGFDLLKKANIKYYEVKFETPLEFADNKFLIWLDNVFNCPFYLEKRKIYFFNEGPAVQLVLFSGDLQKYFNAHQRFQLKQLDNI